MRKGRCLSLLLSALLSSLFFSSAAAVEPLHVQRVLELVSPKEMSVIIKDGKIIPQGRLVGIKVEGNKYLANITVNILDDKASNYYIRTKHSPNLPSVATNLPSPHELTKHVMNYSHSVVLATLGEFSKICGPSGAGFGSLPVELEVGVTDKWVEKEFKGAVVAVRKSETYTRKLPASINVKCEKVYQTKAAVTPLSYSYACDSNEYVEGTVLFNSGQLTPVLLVIPDKYCTPAPQRQNVYVQTCPSGYSFGSMGDRRETPSPVPMTCKRTINNPFSSSDNAGVKATVSERQVRMTCPNNCVVEGTNSATALLLPRNSKIGCQPTAGTRPKLATKWIRWEYNCPSGQYLKEDRALKAQKHLAPGVQPPDKHCVAGDLNQMG